MKVRLLALAVTLVCSTLALVAGVASAAPDVSTNKSSASSASKDQSSIPKPEASTDSIKAYSSDGTLQIGSIVQLDTKIQNQVDASTSAQKKLMYGVVIDANQLPFTVTNNQLKNQVYVATAGSYPALVSTQEGEIKPGDYITISAINGIGMRAGENSVDVIGRAAQGFDGKNDVVGQAELKDKSGKVYKTVAIGTVPVAINIQSNPNQKKSNEKVPGYLQRLGQQLVNKPVSQIRAYLGTAIAILSVIVCITILYAGIHSSMISIGRNPLSKKTIYRGMLEVIITGVLVLIIGVFAVYLLLKL